MGIGVCYTYPRCPFSIRGQSRPPIVTKPVPVESGETVEREDRCCFYIPRKERAVKFLWHNQTDIL